MPAQISIGPLAVNSYTFWIGLAVAAGLGIAVWRARGPRARAFNGCLMVLAGALLLGRAGYVGLNLAYFAEHPGEILSERSPGFSEQAAIAGGLIGWALARRLRQPVDPLGLLAGAALAGIGASIGCAAQGCAYGREVFWTDGLAWALRADWPDATLTGNPRLPAQAFLAAWMGLAWLAALALLRAPGRGRPLQPEPAPVLVWIGLFALGDFAIQFCRADAAPVWLGWRAPQWADLALLGLAAVLLAASHRRRPGAPPA